ncbi:uncharacterized protein LOC129617135 [Condylostylus longicornis]|uniref:uncharacterized protein LOC129617135 n=1 Tax=Condylostylus longicornis TaxID=2530218 RepID=UPI00244E4AA7|nr:uncharacterized protein LOC129617135 [Condylostylus longicornis]
MESSGDPLATKPKTPLWPRPSPKNVSSLPDATQEATNEEAPSPIAKEHLVLDAGAFIRLKQLHLFGFETLHVTPGVAAEIRDRAARQNLNLMVTVPKISTPTEEDLAFVTRFSQQTGDLGFLSRTDLELIALTYMLQRMTGDVASLKSKPESTLQIARNCVVEPPMNSWGLGKDKNDEGEHTDDDDEGDEDDDDDGEWICEDNFDE